MEAFNQVQVLIPIYYSGSSCNLFVLQPLLSFFGSGTVVVFIGDDSI